MNWTGQRFTNIHKVALTWAYMLGPDSHPQVLAICHLGIYTQWQTFNIIGDIL